MKRTFTALAAIVLAACAQTTTLPAAADDSTALTIELTGLEATGTVRIGVYADQAGYDSGAAVTGANIMVDESEEAATIEGLSPGTYALKLFHDVNDNGDMDTNPFGMPIEPFAFSNNAVGSFGPASWDDAKFELTEDGTTQTLRFN